MWIRVHRTVSTSTIFYYSLPPSKSNCIPPATVTEAYRLMENPATFWGVPAIYHTLIHRLPWQQMTFLLSCPSCQASCKPDSWKNLPSRQESISVIWWRTPITTWTHLLTASMDPFNNSRPTMPHVSIAYMIFNHETLILRNLRAILGSREIRGTLTLYPPLILGDLNWVSMLEDRSKKHFILSL